MKENENLEAYKHFAKYYRTLLKKRGFFQRQDKVVRKLISKYILKPSIKILDASCGTGDVLSLLAPHYKFIAGVDGSSEMLSVGISDFGLEGIPLSLCRWERLSSFFKRQGRFDFIFFLGNSISHIKNRKDLEGLVTRIYKRGLRSGGMLAFDIRDWRMNKRLKLLIEPGRPGGCERSLGKFDVEGEVFKAIDICNYSRSRQYITYEMQQRDNLSYRLTVSYLPFSRDQGLRLLRQKGFTSCKVEKVRGWKYPVIIGFKP